MRTPPKKKSKPSDKPERELARGAPEARSAGEVTPGPSDSQGVRPASRRDATRGEAKSGGETRRRGFTHEIPPGHQSPPNKSSSGSDDASTSSDTKGSSSPEKGHEAPGREGEKGSPKGNSGDAPPDDDNPLFGESDEDQKPAAVVVGPLQKGRGADDNPSYEDYEEAIKVPAHLLKEPPATASGAHAEKATGNSQAETPGKTPRAQLQTQATPPKVARPLVVMLDPEE